ncbi:MAG TPA: FAD-dependent oxidoreductase, partial [Rhodothermales bacterium]|nr:FAD-dependent oxidoreductase [Rhodothermales bacterium]
MQYDAIIVGAGLAGSATAAHLAARGHSVLLLEKKQYPAHKLCGEFLSVEVQALFRRLGVLDAVLAAGANGIDRARITAPGGGACLHRLPGTALGLSRFKLDDLLCRHALALGAEVHVREPALSIRGDLESGLTV